MDKLTTYVVFCDDVRQEIGNKKSYIGVYTEELYVPTIPALIPKFCIVTSVACRTEDFPQRLAVEFTLADEPLDKQTVPEEILSDWRKETELAASESDASCPEQTAKGRLFMDFIVSPFMVTKEGRLAVFIETEEGRAWAGSLSIVKKEGVPTTGGTVRKASPLNAGAPPAVKS